MAQVLVRAFVRAFVRVLARVLVRVLVHGPVQEPVRPAAQVAVAPHANGLATRPRARGADEGAKAKAVAMRMQAACVLQAALRRALQVPNLARGVAVR